MPPDNGNGFPLPRVAEMRKHHAQIGKIQRYGIKMHRAREVERCSAYKRRPRMEKDRQAVFYAVAVYFMPERDDIYFSKRFNA